MAIAAALAVVYPHMNSIGGDSFWLLAEPGRDPIGVDACGRAAAAADLDLYRRAGLSAIPWRGPLAANTVAGTLSGWEQVLRIGGSGMPLERLLEPAIAHAEAGTPVPQSLHELATGKRAELDGVPGFASTFLPDGAPPATGAVLRQPALAATFRRIARDGLDSFYRGGLARSLAADLQAVGSPVTLADLASRRTVRRSVRPN